METTKQRFTDYGRMCANTVIDNMGLKEGSRSDKDYEMAKKRLRKLCTNYIVYEGAVKVLARFLGL